MELIAFLVGLVGFLGLHSARIAAEPWRQRAIAARGALVWRGGYSLASLAFFLLLLWGFARVQHQFPPLWVAPSGLRHAVALLMLPAFWLLAAAYVPHNHLKAALKHPMTLAVKLWALAHLLVNTSLPELLLFGGFLLWSVLLFRSARRRPATAVSPRLGATLLTLTVGTAAYAGFAFWLHGAWLGVRPFGAASIG